MLKRWTYVGQKISMKRKGTSAMYAPVAIRLTAVEYPISYGPSEGMRPPQDDIAVPDDITLPDEITLVDDIAIADDIAFGSVKLPAFGP